MVVKEEVNIIVDNDFIMKMRLYLNNSIEILYNKIYEIVIDGVYYNVAKEKLDTILTQQFYKHIEDNKEKITYIKGNFRLLGSDKIDYVEFYVKYLKLHNIEKEASIIHTKDNSKNIDYFINGKKMNLTEWNNHPKRKKYLRKNKLQKLKI